MPKKKTPQHYPKTAPPPPPNSLDTIRRIMRSTGFEEEEAYGQAPDEVMFSFRDEDDIAEGRPTSQIVRLAEEKAKELESAVSGAKTRIEIVDEWISIWVTLPPRTAPRNPEPPKSNDQIKREIDEVLRKPSDVRYFRKPRTS